MVKMKSYGSKYTIFVSEWIERDLPIIWERIKGSMNPEIKTFNALIEFIIHDLKNRMDVDDERKKQLEQLEMGLNGVTGDPVDIS
jgi:hypothetical protein